MKAFIFAMAFLALVTAALAIPQQTPHNDFFSKTHRCIPMRQFVDRCNLCHCGPDGKQAVCTKMFCPTPEKPYIDGYKDGFACPSGVTFYDGCKKCVCNETGDSAECTVVNDCA